MYQEEREGNKSILVTRTKLRIHGGCSLRSILKWRNLIACGSRPGAFIHKNIRIYFPDKTLLGDLEGLRCRFDCGEEETYLYNLYGLRHVLRWKRNQSHDKTIPKRKLRSEIDKLLQAKTTTQHRYPQAASPS